MSIEIKQFKNISLPNNIKELTFDEILYLRNYLKSVYDEIYYNDFRPDKDPLKICNHDFRPLGEPNLSPVKCSKCNEIRD